MFTGGGRWGEEESFGEHIWGGGGGGGGGRKSFFRAYTGEEEKGNGL